MSCHDSVGGETSLALPEAEEEEVAGVLAMAIAVASLDREEKPAERERRRAGKLGEIGLVRKVVEGSGELVNRVTSLGRVDRLNTPGAPMGRSEINGYF